MEIFKTLAPFLALFAAVFAGVGLTYVDWGKLKSPEGRREALKGIVALPVGLIGMVLIGIALVAAAVLVVAIFLWAFRLVF